MTNINAFYSPKILRLFCLVMIFSAFSVINGICAQDTLPADLSGEDQINLGCLRESYPQIKEIVPDEKGQLWLILDSGKKVAYSSGPDSLAESMRQPYPLEPDRPGTPEGISPGRIRPYGFWEAIYGASPKEVAQKLVSEKYLKSSLTLTQAAAAAFASAKSELENLAQKGESRLLKPSGGYAWRKIAGENRLSAHSFGIALDLGADAAPYWRWNKVSPHPMQKTYPGSIVQSMENRGFIWGGKWHEYDLMHFEYRPELICKAKRMAEKSPRAIPGAGSKSKPKLPQ